MHMGEVGRKVLEAQLPQSDYELKPAIIEALGTMGNEAVPALEQVLRLEQDSAYILLKTAEALAAIGTPYAAKVLILACSTHDEETSTYIIQPVLVRMDQPAVVKAAYEVLFPLGSEDAGEEPLPHVFVGRSGRIAVARREPIAIPSEADISGHARPLIPARLAAVEVIGDIGTPNAAVILVLASRHRVPVVRKQALWKLAHMDDELAEKIAQHATAGLRVQIQLAGVEVLKALGRVSVIEFLSDAYKHEPDAGVRGALFNTLRAIRHANQHIQTLKHTDPGSRRSAIASLKGMQTYGAAEVVATAFDDEIPVVRVSARRALAKMGNPGLFALERALERSNSLQKRLEAVLTLRDIETAPAAEIMTRALGDANEVVQRAAQKAFTEIDWDIARAALAKVLHESGGSTFQAAVITVLGMLGEGSIDVISLQLEHNDSTDVRLAAIEALRTIGTAEAARALVPALGQSRGAIPPAAMEALTGMSSEAARAAAHEALVHYDKRIRKAGVALCEALGTDAAALVLATARFHSILGADMHGLVDDALKRMLGWYRKDILLNLLTSL